MTRIVGAEPYEGEPGVICSVLIAGHLHAAGSLRRVVPRYRAPPPTAYPGIPRPGISPTAAPTAAPGIPRFWCARTRAFVNPARRWAALNPDFFKGTAVEGA